MNGKTRFVVFSYSGDDDKVMHSFWEIDDEAAAGKADNPATAMECHAISLAAELEPDAVGHTAYTIAELREIAHNLEERDGFSIRPFQQQVTNLSRAQCEELLNSISIQCRDHETVEELVEAVRANLEDGTLTQANMDSIFPV
jgi:hypothetical protein